MTRKDYQKAAALVVRMRTALAPRQGIEYTISAFCEFFREDNPRFNEVRFREACKK